MTPKRFFFILLGIVVIIVAASGYGYVYALHRLTAAKASLANVLGEQASDQEELDALSRMKVQYAKEVVPELPLMDAALPRTKNQTQLLAQLQAITNESGLSLGAVTFPSPAGLPNSTSQTTAVGQVLALPVSFSVSGSFAKLQTFLTSLENLNRFTNVTSLTVSRPDPSKPIQYSITLNAYIKP